MRSASASLVGRGQNSCAEDRQDSHHMETVPRATHLCPPHVSSQPSCLLDICSYPIELMCGSLISAWRELGQDGRHLPMVWNLSGFSG